MKTEGVGTEKDEKAGVQWFGKAAVAGVPEAQFRMARAAEDGLIDGGDKVAMQWYVSASDQGFGPAKFNLATMYYEGRGTERDMEKAYRLYDEVASSDDADALFMTARMKFEGLGTEQDVEGAMKRFGRSAELGNQLAIEFLSDLRRKQNTQFIKIDGL
jgi:hypothetical protein